MSQPKIAILIDNPLRDLGGAVLVAQELAHQGARSFLVPMVNQHREVFSLRPDFVLLNYLRKNNENFAQSLFEARIPYGIFDTEGGFYGDLNKYGRILSDRAHLHENVLINCIWGQKMFDYWREALGAKSDQLALTGLPRFDFYNNNWREVSTQYLPKKWLNPDPLFLFNTKVSIANAKYLSLKKELNLHKVSLKIPPHEAERHLTLGRQAINTTCEIALHLSSEFQTAKVVIRPHPHERKETYIEKMGELPKNVSVVQEGMVNPWLSRCTALIHRQCTTAIEAVLAGKPAIAPLFMATSAEAPDTELVSHLCHSQDELDELLKASVMGKISETPTIKSTMNKIIDDWLFAVDGESHKRVATHVLERIPSKANIDHKLCDELLFRSHRGSSSIKAKAYDQLCYLSKVTGSTSVLWRLDRKRQAKWSRIGKSFSLRDVDFLLKPINEKLNRNIQVKQSLNTFAKNYPAMTIELSS